MTADLQEAPATASYDGLTLELAREDSGVLARRHTRECLCAWQLDRLVGDAMQIVMELLANVREHTDSLSVTVDIILRPALLLIEVTDYDRRQLPIVLPEKQGDVLAEGGHGLELVAALSKVHGFVRNPGAGLTRFAVIEVA